MKNKQYEITLKHDSGTVRIRVLASSVESAMQRVCDSENAPRRAVQSWRIIPTAAQVRKTQNMLRGL